MEATGSSAYASRAGYWRSRRRALCRGLEPPRAARPGEGSWEGKSRKRAAARACRSCVRRGVGITTVVACTDRAVCSFRAMAHLEGGGRYGEQGVGPCMHALERNLRAETYVLAYAKCRIL